MATKNLFKSASSSAVTVKPVNTVNNAGGTAYSLSDKAALSQYAMTGCFNGTYYCSDEDQLKKTLELALKCEPQFLAKLAVYSREQGLMKDMPAFLAAVLASKDTALLSKIFTRVIDNPKMVRNFCQIIRSGATGRKSFGSRPKKLIQQYLESLTDEQVFRADVGNDPSLQDILKMVRPKPSDKRRNALYGYLLGKEFNRQDLCALAKAFEDFKKDMVGEIPDVPFQMLTALPLTDKHWKQIAENATWTQTRMNLNTFLRHNVFNDSKMIDLVAAKLQDENQVKRAKVFPYQLFAAFKNVDDKMPVKITNALQKASEHAIGNIPEFEGKVYVLPDVSGSMSSPVTGHRSSATTKMRCVDVAGLVAASVLRKNPEAEVIPFDTRVHNARLNPLDSIMTNAETLAKFGGGGTDCHLPLAALNSKNAKGDLIIYVSDNESWVDSKGYGRGTATMGEWKKFKARNPKAKLVCIDITPNATTQAQPDKDILNVGGFSDNVFSVISKFVETGNDKDLWVNTIESVKI